MHEYVVYQCHILVDTDTSARLLKKNLKVKTGYWLGFLPTLRSDPFKRMQSIMGRGLCAAQFIHHNLGTTLLCAQVETSGHLKLGTGFE